MGVLPRLDVEQLRHRILAAAECARLLRLSESAAVASSRPYERPFRDGLRVPSAAGALPAGMRVATTVTGSVLSASGVAPYIPTVDAWTKASRMAPEGTAGCGVTSRIHAHQSVLELVAEYATIDVKIKKLERQYALCAATLQVELDAGRRETPAVRDLLMYMRSRDRILRTLVNRSKRNIPLTQRVLRA